MRLVNRCVRAFAPARAALIALPVLVVLLGLPGTATAATTEGAVIGNGTTQLGVTKYGSLNYDCVQAEDVGCPATSFGGTQEVGLRMMLHNFEATAPGCLCEGWGVADAGPTGLTGWANEASGNSNITVDSFSSPNPLEAISTVTIADGTMPNSTLQVTHHYLPNPTSPLVYNGKVTVKNTGTDPITDLRYRRVMDWDVEPTAFDEWVTLQGSTPQLVFSSDQGFSSSNPLDGPAYISSDVVCGAGYTGPCNFTDLGNGGVYPDVGPDDHGALFDFSFGALAPGESKTFTVIYGAAPDELTALSALSAVGAQVYSLGQPSCTDEPVLSLLDPSHPCSGLTTASGPVEGKPVTFMFAFITTSSDVSISKSASKSNVTVGDVFDYTLTVNNTGNETAASAQVTDQLPAGTELVSATPSQGSCSGTTTVDCALGSLAPSAAATVTITVKATAAGTAVNTATVTTASADPNQANNSASATVAISDPPPPPSVPIVAAADTGSPTVRASRFKKCINSQLRVSVVASDPSGIGSVEIRIDGKRVKSFKSSPVKTGISVKKLSRGRHRLEITVTDAAGNPRVATRSFTRCAKRARTVRRVSPRFTG